MDGEVGEESHDTFLEHIYFLAGFCVSHCFEGLPEMGFDIFLSDRLHTLVFVMNNYILVHEWDNFEAVAIHFADTFFAKKFLHRAWVHI